MIPIRARLPDRRPSVTERIDVEGQTYTATAGIDPHTGAVRELFLDGAKEGSHMDFVLNDTAVIISVAIQHGVAIEALRKSVARIEGAPASVIGAALDFLTHVMEDK